HLTRPARWLGRTRVLLSRREGVPMPETSAAVRDLSPLSMPLEEAMRTQRAVRRLKPDPVADDLVLRLIELATKAPSGSNQQNWEFVVVRDRAVKERLGRLNRMAFSLYSRIARRTADAQMQRIIDAVRWQGDHHEEVRGVIVDGPR